MPDRRIIPGPVHQAVLNALNRGVEASVTALLQDDEVRDITRYHGSPRNAVRRALMNVMEDERRA